MSVCPLYTQVFLGALSGSGSHAKGAYTIETITAGLQVIWMACFESTSSVYSQAIRTATNRLHRCQRPCIATQPAHWDCRHEMP